MAGKPQTLSEGQKDEVVRIFHNKLLKGTLIGLAILAGITGMSLWGIKQRVEAKMEELIAKQFEEPQIQEVVRKVAAERASVLMTEQITPEVTKFKDEIGSVSKEAWEKADQVEKALSEAKIALDEVRSISDFGLLLAKASNDDRASFYALHKITKTENHKFQEIAYKAIEQILIDLANAERYSYKVNWKEKYNLDPAKTSLAEFGNVFKNSSKIHHPTILKTIWKQERFPKVERLNILYEVMTTTQSLRTLNQARQLMNEEAGIDKSILGYDLYVKWWEENREKYNKSP